MKILFAGISLALLALAALPSHAAPPVPSQSAASPQTVAANHVAEWSFVSQRAYADPFHEVTLDAVFTDPDGTVHRVPAFWDGGQTWRVRYAAPRAGRYRFRTECSDATNPELHGVRGALVVTRYRGDNPLYKHGPVRVAADHRRFEHADGTPFLWLGDTWWMGLSRRLSWPDDFQQLAADRKAKGFSVVQIVAGLYPEMAPLDPESANEAGLPWEAGFKTINPAYWAVADRRFQHLVESGLSPCIVGAWGYFLPFMGPDNLKQHWRYLIARYGAYPVFWCVAGEVNLPYYKAPGFPFEDKEQAQRWTAICRYVRETDPFRHPLTVHPTGIGRLNARGATGDPAVLDYDMLQTGHGGIGDLTPTLNTLQDSYTALPTLPVVEGEVIYEAISGPDSNPAALQRLFFWSILLGGGAGYTYGGNGIWQVNLPGKPQITFGNYPTPDWKTAMNLPGSRQVGLGARLLAPYVGPRFAPHPEWISASMPAPLTFEGCNWIWFPEGHPAQDAPVEARYFRRIFTLPADKQITSARLKVAADDTCLIYLNGRDLGKTADWHSGAAFDALAPVLKPGRNVLAIRAENSPAPVTKNPAGLIGKLEVRFADGTIQTLTTDTPWQTAKSAPDGWRALDFNASAWQPAQIAAPYGGAPWGRAGGNAPASIACCAGVPNRMRVIYLPSPTRVRVLSLEPGQRYQAVWVNPADGQRTPAGTARGDADGSWLSPEPPASGQDWVLLLTRGKS